jgi:hypothetical protein
MSKRKYTQISLKEKEKIIEIMLKPENTNEKTGAPNFYKLSKPIEEEGVGHSRQKLQKWWKNRDKIRSSVNKHKRKRTKSVYSAYHSEMETKLKDWIIQQRALGVCVSGFVIRVKALELERAICEQMNKQCLFKASNGWLFNFLRRNRFVLRRITTTGRELPENAIDTILSFIADMEKTFGGQVDIDFDSIINMDESSIYIDMPSNYTYEEKVFKIVF